MGIVEDLVDEAKSAPDICGPSPVLSKVMVMMD